MSGEIAKSVKNASEVLVTRKPVEPGASSAAWKPSADNALTALTRLAAIVARLVEPAPTQPTPGPAQTLSFDSSAPVFAKVSDHVSAAVGVPERTTCSWRVATVT